MQRPTRAVVPSGCVCAVLASSSGSVVFTDSGTGRSSPALITGNNAASAGRSVTPAVCSSSVSYRRKGRAADAALTAGQPVALTLQWHGTSSEDRASPVTLMPPRQSRPSTWECQATCGSRCALWG